MTLAGIEQATFRFVAQHLNHCATAVLTTFMYYIEYNSSITFLGAFAKFRKAAVSSVMFNCLCVCLSSLPTAWKNSAPNERIFMKFDI